MVPSGIFGPDKFDLHLGRGWLTSENSLVRYVNGNDANGYYKAFGLQPGATKEEIKSAYRKLIKRLHPDLGGSEELFRFVAEIASVLLNPGSKTDYDSVGGDGAIYLGHMEREELARAGLLNELNESSSHEEPTCHWACATTSGFSPGIDTDAWIELCRQVAPAVGHRGKIRVAVFEGGQYWPCDLSSSWGLLDTGSYVFVVFQRGVEPNRLHALCAMIELQRCLLKQVVQVQDRERAS